MTIKWNFGPAAERARFNLKGKIFNLKLKKKNKKKNKSSSSQAGGPAPKESGFKHSLTGCKL